MRFTFLHLLFSFSVYGQNDTNFHEKIEPIEKIILDTCFADPQFPGGEKEMLQYIIHHTIYPQSAKEKGIYGKVYLQFLVNKEGIIEDARIVKSSGDAELDAEAIRVIRSMPQWIPAKNCSGNIPVSFTIPINFELN